MSQRLTPIIVSDPQRSDGWYNARLGNLTASNAEKALSFKKPTVAQMKLAREIYEDNGIDTEYVAEMSDLYPAKFCIDAGIDIEEAGERIKLRQEIVAERITRMRADVDGFVTNDMKWGVTNEWRAAELYASTHNVKIEEAPLMLHPKLLCGASPDRLVIDLETGELGNAEIKCLRSANHLYKIINDGKMPDDYKAQVQMQMWISGRDWCDFIGYDSRVSDGLKMFVTRVPFDEFYADNVLVPLIEDFLASCDADERVFRAIANANVKKIKEKEQ